MTQLRGTAGCVSNTGREGCARGRALAGADSVALSPDGRSAYVLGSSLIDAVAVFARDRSTGALSQLRGRAGCVSQEGAEGCARGRAGLAFANSVALRRG